MEDLFDMDSLDSLFGGNTNSEFGCNIYAERMRQDDRKSTEILQSFFNHGIARYNSWN